jgi:hypothetical protein
VLDSAPGRSRSPRSWSTLPRWLRVTLAGAGALVVCAGGAGVAVDRTSAWLTARAERDEVRLEAALGVSSSSTSPVGGRVDYFVTLHNSGPLAVRVDGVSLATSRLRVAGRRGATDVPAGGSRYLPLSAHLDCRLAEPVVRSVALPGRVTATPASGRRRSVPVSMTGAAPLTDVADTLCRLSPRRQAELSGPVLRSTDPARGGDGAAD